MSGTTSPSEDGFACENLVRILVLMRNWAACLIIFDDPRSSFRSVLFCTVLPTWSLSFRKLWRHRRICLLYDLPPFSARAIPWFFCSYWVQVTQRLIFHVHPWTVTLLSARVMLCWSCPKETQKVRPQVCIWFPSFQSRAHCVIKVWRRCGWIGSAGGPVSLHPIASLAARSAALFPGTPLWSEI